MEELKERQHELDFHMTNYFYLEIGGKRFYPQLSSSGNTPCKSGSGLWIRLLFVAESKDSPLLVNKDLELFFNDPFFNTGITKFTFLNEFIQAIPKLKKI